MEPWTSDIKKTERNSDYVIALVIGLVGIVILPVVLEFAIGGLLDLIHGRGTFTAALSELALIQDGTITDPKAVSTNLLAIVTISQVAGEILALIPIFWLYHAMYADDYRRFPSQKKKNILLIVISPIVILLLSILFSTIYQHLGITSDAANEVVVEAAVLKLPVFEVFAVLVVSPVIEEFVFRKCLFGIIVDKFHWNHWIAIGISSVLFALVHAQDVYFFFYLVLALVLGISYDQSKRNIFVSTGVHFLNNLISCLSLLA